MKNKIIIFAVFLILLPVTVAAQTRIVGTVLDELGEPLIGATVQEVGYATNGVQTDHDGKFTISVKTKNAKINISYIGYFKQTLEVKPNMIINMDLDARSLAEVEVLAVGYGTAKKITNAASITQINAEELRKSPTSSVQNALVGRVTGLFQQQTSGRPGEDGANVYIRGISTFQKGADTKPLIMVDDMETSYSIMSQMNPSEIESITLLKDAASTAIYGIRGANGVILITTKKGVEGPAKITFTSEYGFKTPTVSETVLGSYEGLSLLREYYENESVRTTMPETWLYSDAALEHFRRQDMPEIYPDVDWYDLLFKKASFRTTQTLDIRGGMKNLKYFVSLGYSFEDGMTKNISNSEGFNSSYYARRYNIRSNIDMALTKSTNMSIRASGVLLEKNQPNLTGPSSGIGNDWPIFRRILSYSLTPWYYPAKFSDGTYGGRATKGTNPLAMLEYGGYKRNFENNVSGNLVLEQKLDFITKGLSVKGTLGLTDIWGYNRHLTRNSFVDYQMNMATFEKEYVDPTRTTMPLLSVATDKDTTDKKVYLKFSTVIGANYTNSFGAHNIRVDALGTWDSNRTADGIPANENGFSARISYNYNSRYMIEASGAYNGSDLYVGDNYDFFPGVALGWNISEEPFLKDKLKKVYIDFLKVKYSWGEVGSSSRGSYDNLYNENYGNNGKYGNDYYLGEFPTKVTPLIRTKLANRDIRWQIERKVNIGAELRMLDDRLSIDYEYFKNERSNILMDRKAIPNYLGMGSALPPANMGKVSNRGYEVEVKWQDRIGKDISYYVKGNISFAKNTITDYDESDDPQYPLQRRTGHSINQNFGYICDGYYMSQEEIDNGFTNRTPENPFDKRMGDDGSILKPGDLKYRDISGPNGVPDGIIDSYDVTAIGYANIPQINYGVSLGFSYKDFDFSVLFQGAARGSLASQGVFNMPENLPKKIHLERWTEENKYDAKMPRLDSNNTDRLSTFWLRDIDYLRLKNVEVGYLLPKHWFKKLHVSSFRVYASAMNLLTWSDLGVYNVDPESASSSSASGTTAYTNYPQQRTFNFGVQVSF